MDASGWGLDPTYNEMTGGSVTPASGASVALSATGPGNRTVVPSGSGTQTAASPMQGNFVVGLVVFIVFIVAIMFVAKKWGGPDEDFRNIRASAYNVLLIALIAVAGIPVIKVGVSKLADWGVPGATHVNAWAMAA